MKSETTLFRTVLGAGRTAGRFVWTYLDAWMAWFGMAFGLGLAVTLRDVCMSAVADYLGVVVALETTAVAIMVPVVLDVAFRVYEDYRSREVRVYLLRDPRLTGIVTATFVNALVALSAYVASTYTPGSTLHTMLAVYSLSQAAALVIVLLRYLALLRRQLLDEPDWLIERLAHEALEVLPR